MPPPRLFLDANVLFTAALSPEGRSAGLVELAKVGKANVPCSPRLTLSPRRSATSDSSPPALSLDSRRLPLKDAPILGAAVQAGADYLITGNARHFGHLFGEQIGDTTVLTPADALEALL